MLLPLEIIRKISLELPVYYLSVSKEIHELYNNSWFEDKLTSVYMYLLCLEKYTVRELYHRYINSYDFYQRCNHDIKGPIGPLGPIGPKGPMDPIDPTMYVGTGTSIKN